MVSEAKKLQPGETRVAGGWLACNGKVVADDNCRRIGLLISGELNEIARSTDGWDILYVDKNDGRYWQLTYPLSDEHGGGPPCLELILKAEAASKFGI